MYRYSKGLLNILDSFVLICNLYLLKYAEAQIRLKPKETLNHRKYIHRLRAKLRLKFTGLLG